MNEEEGYSPRIESFGRAHCAIDYDLANVSFVEVDGGYVVIDTAAHPDTARRIRSDIEKKIGGKPLAVIFTHSHPDHTGGASVFAREGVPVWAHEAFESELELYQILPNSYYERGAKQFGLWLGSDQHPGAGIGPNLIVGSGPRPPVVLPTHTFSSFEELEIGGVTFHLHAAPGETHDHLFVWLPDERVLFVADNIYEAFPNLYAIRGVPPRPVRGWIDSLDAMRRLDPRPEVMIPGHTALVTNADRIHELLTAYRDSIAWVHDSVVRGLNAGKTPDDLVDEIRLPEHLADHPYLVEKYGTLAGAVRGICDGYNGWFDGTPGNLPPLLHRELSARLVPTLGGEDAVRQLARKAIDANDHRWALWLIDLLGPDEPTRPEILERRAEEETNPLHRNWLKTEAALAKGTLERNQRPEVNSETIAALPVESFLRLAAGRIHPENSMNVTMSVGYEFTDSEKRYTFHIRKGIGELAPGLAEDCDVVVRATEANFKRILVAGEEKPISRRYWKDIQFTTGKKGILAKFKVLRILLRLRRCIMRL